jgi:DnaK suppressor protein
VGVKVISVPQGADGGARGTSLKEVELTAAKKLPAGTKKVAPAKKVAAAKKAVPAARTSSSPAKKATTAPATKKAAPAAKAATKAAPAAKAAAKKAPAAKTPAKKAPGATKVAPTKKSAPAPAPVPAPSPAPVKAVKKAVPEPPKRPTVGPYVKDVKFLDAQRVLLHEERTIYSGQAIDLRAEADSLALEREPGDRERNLALSAQAAAAVEEIDDALKKLDRKSYGWCERCYQPIPKARLQALPFARLCVACKSGGLSRR